MQNLTQANNQQEPDPFLADKLDKKTQISLEKFDVKQGLGN